MDNRFSMKTLLSPPDEREKVWEKLYEGISRAKTEAHPKWAEMFEKLNLKNHPDIEDISIPGWSTQIVEGKVNEKRFWQLLSKSIFPVNIQLRNLAELDYCILRDYFHDTIGHLAPLYDFDYSTSIRLMGCLGTRVFDRQNVEAQKALSRIYWACIEFSGMKYEGEILPFGAGIVSSKGELKHFLETPEKYTKIDFDEIINWEYDPEGFQDKYFIIVEWEDVNKLLDKFVKKYL